MSFQNLRIGARLYLAFGLVLALLLAIALLGANRIAVMQQGLQDIILVNDAEIALASTMRQTVDDRMIALRNIVLLTSAEEMRPEIERVSEQSRLFDVAVADMHKVFDSYPGTSDEERQALAKVEAAAGEAAPIMQKVVTLGSANQGAEAIKVLMQELRPVQRKWRDGLAALVDSETRQNHEAVEEAGAAYRHALLAIGSITALAILFGGFIAWAITRGIVVPLKHAVKVAQNVAQGDLTSRIVVRGKDESAELMGALGSMNGSLADLVTSVRASATAVSSSSAEIAAGNSDLSARTEEQASSLEETAAAMEELTTTVRANADNAAQANQLVTVAAQIVAEGGTAVGRVVATMDAISTSSKKITEIIGVIDGIAFQTNILALNAAVEAARAGEQGRGFAVVASEVRNLAHRSATAAREIKELITASVDRVEDGNQLALAAGATMQRALDSVQQVSGIMTEISQASREQSGGIAQVNTAIVNMDMVTQQNAALVEEAAAAATAMSQQAAGLTAQIARFRTGNGAGRHPAMLAAA